MPKSRHGKGKHYRQIKKTTPQRPPGTAAAPSTAAAPAGLPQTAKPAAVMPATATPATARSAATSGSTGTAQYPYIFGDLARIGILSGIIFVILIILYFILR